MQTLLELLKLCAESHTFDSGDPDNPAVLDQLFCEYQDSHETDPPEIKDGFKEPDVHSVIDICWYTLARKMSEDVAPEDMGRKKKYTTVYDRNENEGVIMSCPFCGEAFIHRSNRAMTCRKPECTRARKRLNKKNSRQKQKITAQQSK